MNRPRCLLLLPLALTLMLATGGLAHGQQTFKLTITGTATAQDTGFLVFNNIPQPACGTNLLCADFGVFCAEPWVCAPGDTDVMLVAQLASVINTGGFCSGSGITAVATGNVLDIVSPVGNPPLELCWVAFGELGGCVAAPNDGLPLQAGGLECTINNVCNGTPCDETLPATGGFTIASGIPPAPVVTSYVTITQNGPAPVASDFIEFFLTPAPAPCAPVLSDCFGSAICGSGLIDCGGLDATALASAIALGLSAGPCPPGVTVTSAGPCLTITNDTALSGADVFCCINMIECPAPFGYGLGGPGDCFINNVCSGACGDEDMPPGMFGYNFTKTEELLATATSNNGQGINLDVQSAPPAIIGAPWSALVTVVDPSHPPTGVLVLLFNPTSLPTGPRISLGGPLTELLIGPASLGQPCPPFQPYAAGTGIACAGTVIPDDCALIGVPWCTQVAVGTPAAGFTFTNSICGVVGTF